MFKRIISRLDRIIALLESIAAPTVLRPCLVSGYDFDKPCLLHRIIEENQALLRINTYVRPGEAERMYKGFKERGIIPPGCDSEPVRRTFALVELPTGEMQKVEVNRITFLDTNNPK